MVGLRDDFIDRTFSNPFPGRSLTDRNLLGDGQNLPEIDGFIFYFHLNCGGF
jgi:hypothetical protein